MVDVGAVLDDLRDEGGALDALVASLPEARWRDRTPAAGWTVAHQVAHLAWTDDVALRSATDPEGFARLLEEAARDPHGAVDGPAERGAAASPAELLDRWRRGRAELLAALRDLPEGRKLDWFGPPMSAASMTTGRIMETWAHGQDVADTLGVTRAPTARLRHVAHIGIRARDFAYALHGQSPPTEPFRIALTGPSGETWTWGPDDAPQRVGGPALDFCLLVTQRRHPDDLAVTAKGTDAEHWLTIAQAFAGPPGGGRKPGQFT